jgi:hypothetical protein
MKTKNAREELHEFSKDALLGFIIQAQDIRNWMPKLSDDAFLAICKEAAKRNDALPYTATIADIWSGQSITEFVCNWTKQ